MVGQLVVAQFDLETVITALMRSGGDAATAQTQLQNITQLRQQIGTASPTALAALRSEIVAAVAQSQSAVQDARTAASGAVAADGATVASLASTSREQVNSLMRDMHRFDKELDFDTPQEEAAYRQREAERRAFIEQEQRKGTPQGDLNAAGGALGQMADAHAHGADSPAFQQRWNELADSTQKLRAAILRDGGDVAKFDERLRDDFRRILKSKGKSDAEIDALLAAHPDNPLEAVKGFVGEGKDVAVLEQTVQEANKATDEHSKTVTVHKNEYAALDDMAKFRATGIVLTNHAPDQPFAHGVSANEVAGPSSGRG